MTNKSRLPVAKSHSSATVRVLVASASAIRRAGLETMVKSTESLRLAGSLPDVRRIPQHMAELRPDVVLLDLDRQSPPLLPEQLQAPAVVLIDGPNPGWAALALRSGVNAILQPDAGGGEILRAIIAARSGLVLLGQKLAKALAENVHIPSSHPNSSVDKLTARELEVLAMLSEGLGNREIADRLGVSDHTIKFHISSILDKLGASTRTEAVTTALRMGLILL